MILLDTSAWVHLLQASGPRELPDTVPFDAIVTCLPVVQEVLQGFSGDLDCQRATQAFEALPCVEDPLSRTVVLEAVDLYRRACRAGVTPRSGVDCLIAACAIRHDLEVVHRDRDFIGLAQVSSLRQRALAD